MRERLFIIGVTALLVVALVGLNAASYVQKEKVPDSEAVPHRSTYNTGPTGLRAFHDLLVSTGHQVERWERPVSELADPDNMHVSIFVIVGKTRKEITEIESGQILTWVHNGGSLVVVDRDPLPDLLRTTGAWKIETANRQDALSQGEEDVLISTVDPSNSKQMTDGQNAAKPFQPTAITESVTAIQPSKFASSIVFKGIPVAEEKIIRQAAPPQVSTAPPNAADEIYGEYSGSSNVNNVPIQGNPETGFSVGNKTEGASVDSTTQNTRANDEDELAEVDYTVLAPVVHFGTGNKNLVATFPYGYGSIAVVSDPYIISNGGVNLVDNAVFGVNLLSGGTVAFDEFHQGYGSNQNRLLSYFTGTPVVPVFLQLCLLLGLLMVSQSRRFGRPLPLREPNRLSKLEYVAAMAQLEKRTRAYDLAIENIYKDFRRRISRLAGFENSRKRDRDIAIWVAKRTDYTKEEVFELMARCEDIMHGEVTNKKTVLEITTKIRAIEKALGLRRGRHAIHK